jgi:hypothetical protein
VGCPAQAADNACIRELAAVDNRICLQAEDLDALDNNRGTVSNTCPLSATGSSSLARRLLADVCICYMRGTHGRQEACSVQHAVYHATLLKHDSK